jgi:hypothetical protein
VLERVVGAGLEESLPDFWLGLPAHRAMFSRNDRYVYCFSTVDRHPARRSR